MSDPVSDPPSGRRKPKNRSQQSLRRPTRESYSTRTIHFESGDASCVGTLYLPARPDNPPIVVMAHGLGLWQSFGLPAIAERFAEAGYAAFVFDFRYHGDSGGEPRGLVSPTAQCADYEAAIEAMVATDDVDSNRLVLWGFSLSGGHVLSVAAANFRVAGVIATVPFVDGRSELKRLIRAPKTLVKSVASGVRDRLGRRVGFGREVRIVDDPDGFGVITESGAKRAIFDLVDRESNWQNAVPARVFLDLPRYRPIASVDEIRCPTLAIGGRDDRIVPAAGPEAAADAIASSTYIELPTDHLSVLAEDFDTVVDHQLAFLRSTVAHR